MMNPVVVKVGLNVTQLENEKDHYNSNVYEERESSVLTPFWEVHSCWARALLCGSVQATCVRWAVLMSNGGTGRKWQHLWGWRERRPGTTIGMWKAYSGKVGRKSSAMQYQVTEPEYGKLLKEYRGAELGNDRCEGQREV